MVNKGQTVGELAIYFLEKVSHLRPEEVSIDWTMENDWRTHSYLIEQMTNVICKQYFKVYCLKKTYVCIRNLKDYLWRDFSDERLDLSFSNILRLSIEQLGEKLLDCDKLDEREEHTGETFGGDFSENEFFHSRQLGIE
jgi:hypothetical protein